MCNNSHHTLDMLLHYLVKYNNSKLAQITKYNKMSSYLSLTQLKTLPVQRVTDVVTEFVRNVPLLPAHRLKVVRATQEHSVPCRAKHPRDAASVDPHRERVTDRLISFSLQQCKNF